MKYLLLGGPALWAILGLSVIATAVVLERIRFYHSASTDPESLELALGEALYAKDVLRAKALVEAQDSSLHRLFRLAVSHWQIDPEAMKILLEQQVRREMYRWQRGLGVLSMTARVSPLLGLLGTVLGIIGMFRGLPGVLEGNGGGGSMAAIASGIWEALITTVAGLAVAVPAILCYTYLTSRIDSMEETLNRGVDFVVREKLLSGSESRRIGDVS